MSYLLKPYIDKIKAGEHLTRDESYNAMHGMMSGQKSKETLADFLTALAAKGETPEELVGAVECVLAHGKPFQYDQELIDTCGTGGDVRGTLNISTAVAIVVAACGLKVAKHGGSAVSSQSGSADVLRALGVHVGAMPDVLRQCLDRCNIAFFFAPNWHPAMRHVAPIRQKLKIRTIFNLIGPLANPARPARQLLGVYAPEWLEPIAQVLGGLGRVSSWVVHGEDGVDEISVCGNSWVADLYRGSITMRQAHPNNAGLPVHELHALRGGDAEFNAQAIVRLLDGEHSAYRDAVLLNTAGALMIAQHAKSLREGVEIAMEAIDSGRARDVLTQWAMYSNH